MSFKNYPLFIIIVFAISIAIIFFLVLPKYRSYSGFKKEAAEKSAELQSQEEYIEELKSTHQKLKTYQESLAKIESAIPENRSLSEVLSFFQETASQTGLIMEKVNQTFVTSGLEEDIKITKIDVGLRGNYEGFKNFIETIEKISRLIEVDSIYFIYPNRGDLFDFSISANVYSQ